MSFLSKLFHRKSGSAPLLIPPPPYPVPPDAPATLKTWDDYGRICEIPREEWRTKVLPINFQNAWNNPDQLAALIHSALNDHFVPDALEPARQLYRIDPQPKRGATFLAVILLQLKQFGEAEKVVTETMQRHGEDGVLLTNLAKAQYGKGDSALSERTLWHALEIDPNLDNGLLWYEAIHRERGGENAGLDALRRIAALPNSWRPQLWLARAALKSKQLDEALRLYRECLARAAKPAPADLLQQISGDLGNAGHLPEILQIVAPHFDAAAHNLLVGNNLIKAHFDLGQFDAARQILDQLYKQNRGDWKEHLAYWDTEIAKAHVTLHDTPKEIPAVAMLTIAGPVWLKPESPAAELFPAKSSGGSTVAFIGSAAEIITNSKRPQHQMSDAPGRMTRALPLFLAEQVDFGSNARVETIIPWVTGEAPAFVFSGGPWKDEDAANYARQTAAKNDYVVILFLKPNAEPWSVELRLVRTIDAKCLGTLTGSFPFAQPETGIPMLGNQLLELLREQAEVETFPPPSNYQIPVAPWFGSYLLRLEQLLAVRCAGMDGVDRGSLSGEREILDGNLQLCLEYPNNVGARILLMQTMLSMKRARPAVLPEYHAKMTRLQKEKPLPEPANSIVQRMINEVLTA